jgi:acyl-coenzyme A synthetase/AMP-(fatty) acid ligase
MNHLINVLAAGNGNIALIESLGGEAERSVSYRTLLTHAGALGAAMPSHGLHRGDCVAVVSRRPSVQISALLAAVVNGLVVQLIDPALPLAARRMLTGQTHPRMIVVDGDEPAGHDMGTQALPWSALFEARHTGPVPQLHVEDAGGIVVHTSGRTGPPRAVLLRWQALRAAAFRAIDAFGYTAGWVCGSLLPRSHAFTLVVDVLPALMLSNTVVLADEFDMRCIDAIASAFARHRVCSYSASPAVLQGACTFQGWADITSLRFAVAGLAALPERTRMSYLRRFGHPALPCYGTTEAAWLIAATPPPSSRSGATGLPVGMLVRALADDGQPLPQGVDGHLAVQGALPAAGEGGDTAHGGQRTGDIGHVDSEGWVRVRGRATNRLQRGGQTVQAEDIDRCLIALPWTAQCVSFVRHAAHGDAELVTFVVANELGPAPREDIDQAIIDTLGQAHVPDRVHVVARLPHDHLGRIAHAQLLAMAGQQTHEPP